MKVLRSVAILITALLATIVTVRLIFTPDSFPPDQVGDMTLLTGILWGAATLMIGVRRPPPPPPPVE